MKYCNSSNKARLSMFKIYFPEGVPAIATYWHRVLMDNRDKLRVGRSLPVRQIVVNTGRHFLVAMNRVWLQVMSPGQDSIAHIAYVPACCWLVAAQNIHSKVGTAEVSKKQIMLQVRSQASFTSRKTYF